MKAFISHDSRDKNRFVKEFATKLLEKGIDVWYDDWELQLGDSLMKIFEEIPKCDIFITIISKYSIHSKWVKEESDSGFVSKIENNMKFLPIILMEDDFEIPNYLNHLIQCRIYDINNYETEFDKIVSTIYGITDKPQLGSPPKYLLEKQISGLKRTDTIVLRSIGEYMLKNGECPLRFNKVVDLTKEDDLSAEEVSDSLEVLTNKFYISSKRFFGAQHRDMIRLTYAGTIEYGKNYIEDFNKIMENILAILLNDTPLYSEDIFKKINEPKILIKSIIENFSKKGYLDMTNLMGGDFVVKRITVEGKRYFKEILL